MATLLRSIFVKQGIVENREPVVSFAFPGVDGTWGLLMPSIDPWKILAILVIIQAFIQCLFAVLIYYFIIKRRGSMEAFLLGWGIIVPFSLYIPFGILDLLELQNRVVNLSLSTVMSVVFFRCVEAMYGTSPPFVEDSLSNYVAYYSAIIPFVWDPNTRARSQISMHKFLGNMLEVGMAFLGTSAVLSFLTYYDFRPFPSSVRLDKLEWTWELLSLNHIANSYCHALLIYGTLKTGFELSALNENIKGNDTHRLFDAPLTRSRTPTEFWTKRWNMITQKILKTGVFLPARKYCSSKVAVFITFLVSGLYHDYVWYCIFFDLKDDKGNCIDDTLCYDHHFGHVTLFFCYVGLIMMLERPVGKFSVVQWLSKKLPVPVTAHLLLLVHLPMAYWYYGDWIEGGYFDHFAIALFQVKKL